MAKENGTTSNTNDCDLNESDIGDIRKFDGNSLNVNTNNDRHQTVNSETKEPGNSNGGTPEPPSKREENPFSLKHFLKREQNSTPSASTNGTNSLSSTNNVTSATSSSYQNSTGARPKVLQSDITMLKERDSQLNQQQQHQSTINKMKRSPRFPSFDSQASLNEYKHDDSLSMTNLFHSRSNTSFPSSTGGSGMLIGCNVNEEYSPGHDSFQRSFSNYDIDNHRHSQLTTSPRTDRRKARFSNNGTGIPCSSSNSGRNSEFPSALPDFVQDHLVVEQLYNAFGNSPPASTSPLTVEGGDQDSDFEDLISRVRPEILPSASCNDIPFDLTFNSTNNGRRSRTRNSPIPLDLPSNLPPDIPLDLPQQLPSKSGIASNLRARDGRRNPLSSADLTLDLTGASNSESRNSGYIFPTNDNLDINNCDTSKIQTLPDFLSDGPIHSSGRLADLAQDLPIHLNQSHHHHHHFDSPDDDSANCGGGGSSGSAISRVRLENERLRQELDDGRRILSERNRRINELERIIENERKNEYKYTTTLAHSMEQVEENLDKSNKRAAAAQSLANKLKQQVKQLTAEIETLKRENEILRDESSGAVGGSGIRSFNRPSRTQQLSRELMQAASTAESNLKQLLTGVDNLRLMAATIENMDRVSDRNNTQQQQQQPQQVDYLSDCDADDDDDCTGPAL